MDLLPRFNAAPTGNFLGSTCDLEELPVSARRRIYETEGSAFHLRRGGAGGLSGAPHNLPAYQVVGSQNGA